VLANHGQSQRGLVAAAREPSASRILPHVAEHPDLETYVGPPIESDVKPRRSLWRHTERFLIGLVMGFMAWFLERAVKKAEKRKAKTA